MVPLCCSGSFSTHLLTLPLQLTLTTNNQQRDLDRARRLADQRSLGAASEIPEKWDQIDSCLQDSGS